MPKSRRGTDTAVNEIWELQAVRPRPRGRHQRTSPVFRNRGHRDGSPRMRAYRGPTLEELRKDLRTVTKKCRPDWTSQRSNPKLLGNKAARLWRDVPLHIIERRSVAVPKKDRFENQLLKRFCSLSLCFGGGSSRAKLVSDRYQGKIQGKNEKSPQKFSGVAPRASIDAGF